MGGLLHRVRFLADNAAAKVHPRPNDRAAAYRATIVAVNSTQNGYGTVMRPHYEFSLHRIAAEHLRGGVDSTLAMMGSQGWELRGITSTPDGGIVLALQRPFDDEKPLPDASTLAATLEAPVAPPASATGEYLCSEPKRKLGLKLSTVRRRRRLPQAV